MAGLIYYRLMLPLVVSVMLVRVCCDELLLC